MILSTRVVRVNVLPGARLGNRAFMAVTAVVTVLTLLVTPE